VHHQLENPVESRSKLSKSNLERIWTTTVSVWTIFMAVVERVRSMPSSPSDVTLSFGDPKSTSRKGYGGSGGQDRLPVKSLSIEHLLDWVRQWAPMAAVKFLGIMA
jgi:hypothetical protein